MPVDHLSKSLPICVVLLLFLVVNLCPPAAYSLQCFACPPYPCAEMTCEGSWCVKSVLYDRVRDETRVVSDCVSEDLRSRVKKDECQPVRNDDRGIRGTRCFCKTKFCNSVGRPEYFSFNFLVTLSAFVTVAFRLVFAA